MRLEGGVLLSLRARVCVCLRRETWEASHNISAAKHRNPLSMLWRPAVVINNGNCAKLNPPRGHSPTCGRRRLPRFAPPPFSPFFFPTFRILEQASYSGIVIERYEDRSEREILSLNRVVRVFFFSSERIFEGGKIGGFVLRTCWILG